MQIEERQYQADDVNNAMDHGIQDKVIHCAPTGSGKTIIQALICKREYDCGDSTAILTPRNEIFDQTHRIVADLCGWSNVSTLRAKREGETWNPVNAVHIVSWPTLIARAKRSDFWFPKVKRVLVDECHLSMAPKILEILEHYAPKAVIDGYTATPARMTGKGLGRFFTHIKHVTSVRQLIKDGYLAPCEYWGGATPDMHGIKIRRGDYEVKKLSRACVKLVGDVVDNWLRLASDRHTIVFAVDIAHCELLAEKFQHVGIRAAALHTKMDDTERDAVVAAFKSGRIQVLCNVSIACLDEQTEILTSDGWVDYSTVTKKHKIANWKDGEIFFAEPLGVNVRNRKPDERMVFLETKNRSVRVTEGHRMLYRTLQGGRFKECKAHTLVDRSAELPISGQAKCFDVSVEQEEKLKRKIWQNAYALRQAGFVGDSRSEAERRAKERDSMRYKDPAELTIYECEFIGFWLGDGSGFKQKCGSMAYSLSQSERYSGIIKWIDILVSALGYDVRRRRSHDKRENRLPMVQWVIPRGTGFGNQKRKGLYAIEPYLIKNGTKYLWGLNEIQFAALMRGFWMADGQHGKAEEPINDRWLVGNTNRELLDLLQAIGCCRGYRTNIFPQKSNEKRGHKPLWMLSMSRRDSHAMTKYRLQFEDGWKQEKVWCVRSHSGFIVTRRRGTVTVVGNSYGFDAPSVNCIVQARPTKSIVLHLQMIGRGMRPAMGEDDLPIKDPEHPDFKICRILDHAGNVPALGQADDLFRWRLDQGKKACENWTRDEQSGEAEEAKQHECEECHYIFSRSRVCPNCGWKVPFTKRDVATAQADLVRIGKALVEKLPKGWVSHEIFFCMLKRYGAEHSYKPGWAAVKFKEKVGCWPERHWMNMVSVPPDKRVLNWITSRNIAYAKRRQKSERRASSVSG